MKNEEIEEFITKHPDWYVEDEKLTAGFEFADFSVVMEKVSQIMQIAEAQDHHPDVTFSYKIIRVQTVTHDAGNKITEKDFSIAEAISNIVSG